MGAWDAVWDFSCCPRILEKAQVSTVGTKHSAFQVPRMASMLRKKREGTSTPSMGWKDAEVDPCVPKEELRG